MLDPNVFDTTITPAIATTTGRLIVVSVPRLGSSPSTERASRVASPALRAAVSSSSCTSFVTASHTYISHVLLACFTAITSTFASIASITLAHTSLPQAAALPIHSPLRLFRGLLLGR